MKRKILEELIFCASVVRTLIFHSWWVILFMLACYVGFYQGAVQQDRQRFKLEQRRAASLWEKEQALIMYRHLQQTQASQNDPAWVELVLMRELGVVPQGYIKVYFKD